MDYRYHLVMSSILENEIKILLIEDKEADSKLIKLSLQKTGVPFQLVWVDRLTKAFEELATNHYDAILLDLGLPDSMGVESIERLRQTTLLIPIIVLTGRLDKKLAYASLRKGADDYLEKEVFTHDTLIRAINYAIERKKAEKTIQEQQRALFSASKLMALGEITSYVFHEIGNPLAALSFKTQMLNKIIEEGGALDQELLKNSLDEYQKNIVRITKILDSLKRYAQGSTQEAFEEIRIKDIFSGTIELCLNRFNSNHIFLQIPNISPDLILECRPVQITQVLVNLLNNSMDAVSPLEKKWVKIDAKDLGNSLELSVTDSGLGIPSEIRDSILETFFTTKARGKGTGLGLSITRRIVEEHGGEFFIDHESPNTRFVVRLPKKH